MYSPPYIIKHISINLIQIIHTHTHHSYYTYPLIPSKFNHTPSYITSHPNYLIQINTTYIICYSPTLSPLTPHNKTPNQKHTHT
jgi:hypothetical protein